MITVLGIDPGDTAGFLLAGWRRGERKAAFARAFQCDGPSAAGLLGMILAEFGITAAQIEAFDSRPGVRRLHGTSPAVIRAQVHDLAARLREHGIPVVTRQVSDVKTWAEVNGDKGEARLEAAGIWDLVSPAAMIHARSAAWHALYCAVHDCGVPDPLPRGRVRSS